MTTDTKECPFCGESIKTTAKKCRYCGEFFEGQTRELILASQQGGHQIKVDQLENISGLVFGEKAQVLQARNVGSSIIQSQGDVTIEQNDINSIMKAFAILYQKLNQMPDSPKKVLAEQAVKGLEAEAQKKEQADEKKIEDWFTSLMAILPDIGEVAIQTFINPISGLSTVFQKVAKRAKEIQQR